MRAAEAVSIVARSMETSMERLSTGKRINSSSDDAAGVAIASRLSAEIRGTDQAIRNSLDGQALIDTAEGAHKEIENILQRMREVAVQAANDTNNGQDRANLQSEMDAMVKDIDRIAETTTWAGTNLMKESTSDFSFQVGTATGEKNQIKVEIGGMTAANLDLSANSTTSYNAVGTVDNASDIGVSSLFSTGAVTTPSVSITTDASAKTGEIKILDVTAITGVDTLPAAIGGSGSDATDIAHTITLKGVTATITGDMTHDIGAINDAFGVFGVSAAGKTGEAVLTTYGHVGGAKGAKIATGYITLTFTDVNNPANISVQSSNAQNLKADSTNNTGSTTNADENARSAIGKIDTAIKNVNIQRSELGAVSNRLNHTVNNLTNISSNLSAAKGGIEDADFALETTNLAKNQILQQASTAMLAQANASKQNVLSLLQG
jgi:flagellin